MLFVVILQEIIYNSIKVINVTIQILKDKKLGMEKFPINSEVFLCLKRLAGWKGNVYPLRPDPAQSDSTISLSQLPSALMKWIGSQLQIGASISAVSFSTTSSYSLPLSDTSPPIAKLKLHSSRVQHSEHLQKSTVG